MEGVLFGFTMQQFYKQHDRIREILIEKEQRIDYSKKFEENLLVINYRKIYISDFDYRLYDMVEINGNVYIIADIIDFQDHREYHISKLCENMREVLEYFGNEFDDYER